MPVLSALRVRRSRVTALAALLALHALVIKLAEVVATAGFVGSLGTRELPVLWIADTVLALVAGVVCARFIDRMPRSALAARLFVAFGVGYGMCALLLVAPLHRAPVYAALYVLSAQQVALVPLVVWTLAMDTYADRDTARLFPVIAAGETVGQLVGYGFSAAIGASAGASVRIDVALLALAVALCAGAAALCAVRFAPVPGAAPTETDDAPGEVLATAREHRVLRPLSATVLLGWVAMSWLAFHVIASLDAAAEHHDARFRVLYAIYNLGSVVLILAVQSLVSGSFLARFGRRGLQVYPATLAFSAALLAGVPGAVAAVACACGVYVAYYAADIPARHAVLAQVPSAQRGRATTLVDNYAYAVGSVLGALLLLVARWVPASVAAGVAGLAALAAWEAARRVRDTAR